MVWHLFAAKLETSETMEDVALKIRVPYFSPLNKIISLPIARFSS
jgi:hypothetical protein